MNTVRLAAAGAGKTWKICHESITEAAQNANRRILLVTYTNRGIESIRLELENQSEGIIPPNIVVLSWYQFLLRELIRPYQTFIVGINEIKSLDYSHEHERNYAKAGTRNRYVTFSGNVRSEQASELALLLNTRSGGMVFDRLKKLYAAIYIDEVQDMAGRDIDILNCLFRSGIQITCVGDNKQATFQTHTTRTNKKLSGSNIIDYFMAVRDENLAVIEWDLCSRRFNSRICSFANAVYPNKNVMSSCMEKVTGHDGVYLISKQDGNKYYEYYAPQELRLNKKTTDIYGERVVNFGECKGKTYDRCLIHPPKPMIDFLKGKALNSPEKYYVAVTRARYSVAILVDRLFQAKGFEPCTIEIMGESMNAMRYIGQVD